MKYYSFEKRQRKETNKLRVIEYLFALFITDFEKCKCMISLFHKIKSHVFIKKIATLFIFSLGILHFSLKNIPLVQFYNQLDSFNNSSLVNNGS